MEPRYMIMTKENISFRHSNYVHIKMVFATDPTRSDSRALFQSENSENSHDAFG